MPQTNTPAEVKNIDGRIAYEDTIIRPEDLDLEPITSELEDYESSPAEYEITTYPADYTLAGLHEKWKQGDIAIPKFQRQFVWKQIQASKLIESFLVGLPVPAIFLYTERKSQKHLVIDGQQRLKSIFYFLEGFFGEEEKGRRQVFRLKGLSKKSKFFEKTFEDFEESDQKRLKDAVLRSFIVQQLDPQDETSIYHIFERLNTGGTLLTNQEVRNCVYHGAFNDLVVELNSNAVWRTLLGKPAKDSRQRDDELILRYFGFLDRTQYEKPLKDYLSKFMRRQRGISDEQRKKLRQLFEQTVQAVVTALGPKPFHVRAGLNSAVFDSVMIAFARNLAAIPPDIEERYRRLVSDPTFFKYTSGATTDEEAVKQRFELAEKVLFQ